MGTVKVDSDASTALAALTAVATGDLEAARSVVASGFVWHIPGSSAIGGEVRGADAWSAKLQRLLAVGLRPEPIALLEAPGRVAVLQRNVANAHGHDLDVRVINLFSVADGKVERLDTFFEDQHAVESFWDAVLG